MIEEVDGPVRVLVEGDPPVGFAHDRLGRREAASGSARRPPARMRQGIGGRLVAAVCDHAASERRARRDADDLSGRALERAVVRAARLLRAGPDAEWGPELRALVEHERELGIEVAPRVVMRRVLDAPSGRGRASARFSAESACSGWYPRRARLRGPRSSGEDRRERPNRGDGVRARARAALRALIEDANGSAACVRRRRPGEHSARTPRTSDRRSLGPMRRRQRARPIANSRPYTSWRLPVCCRH